MNDSYVMYKLCPKCKERYIPVTQRFCGMCQPKDKNMEKYREKYEKNYKYRHTKKYNRRDVVDKLKKLLGSD